MDIWDGGEGREETERAHLVIRPLALCFFQDLSHHSLPHFPQLPWLCVKTRRQHMCNYKFVQPIRVYQDPVMTVRHTHTHTHSRSQKTRQQQTHTLRKPVPQSVKVGRLWRVG